MRFRALAATILCLAVAAGAQARERAASKRRTVKLRASAHVHWGIAAEVYIPPRSVGPTYASDEPPSVPPTTTRDHGYGGFTGFALVVPPVGASMQGGGAGFRIHGAPALALDVSVARAWGSDARGSRRVETPIALAALLYPSPGGTLQPYFPLGVFYDWSAVRDGVSTHHYRHVGGFAGFGLEVFLSKDFSVFGDARAMLRGRVGGDPGPEFSQGAASTNTSTGMLVVIGAAWYPFGKY